MLKRRVSEEVLAIGAGNIIRDAARENQALRDRRDVDGGFRPAPDRFDDMAATT